MNYSKKFFGLVTILLLSISFSAYKPDGTRQSNVTTNASRAAGCAPATASTELDLNNVRALVNSGGDLWYDQISARYEVPKGSGHTAIYAGSLWMGGEDANGQLKIAALMFRQGNDFWTGPLTNNDATVTPETCNKFDRHFVISRAEVEQFRAWFRCNEDPNCDANASFPNYQIPSSILNWPAHGNASEGQDHFLAPFKDVDDNGWYEPQNGDYPFYDLDKEINCKTRRREDRVPLYGDQTIWWVFNDKGNIHTETGEQAIGMEIHGQAFAFATNDEINNMTFYNYEMINRGTQTLNDTYFAQWVDVDLGNPDDDYVGCDVGRGLAYCYNGDAFDQDNRGAIGYGANPPAIGVDFFEGPYQDYDGIDNAFGIGTDEALNGLGYGDGEPDNERFGMRRFLYHINDQGLPTGDPQNGKEYYDYMRGIWRDGTPMVYGGNGHTSGGGDPSQTADFMFPGDTDPLAWGTGGNAQPAWSELTEGNTPLDKRFMQSAGPFTLEPGAVNNITVGVLYARASSSDPFASVEALRVADDKAQALFENCFRILDGPDAPDMAIQEMDKTLILTIKNPTNSNNYNEAYEELDPFIPESVTSTVTSYIYDSITGQYTAQDSTFTTIYDRNYRFQGYQIFQLKNDNVSAADLGDPDLARLVFQSDIKDSIGQLVNYELDEGMGVNVPMEMVDGADDGISHSIKITEDVFATGDRRLINHKQYYYMAIAYAYNNFKTYDPNDPNYLDGQKKPYKASRRSANGGEIAKFVGIPHIPAPEAGGTVHTANYGDSPEITRIEGQGNGARVLNMTYASEMEAMAGPPWKVLTPTYRAGQGPINVKVIDPLNVPAHDFILRFVPDSLQEVNNATWMLINTTLGDTIFSDKTIQVGNEQLVPEYGISVHIEQYLYDDHTPFTKTDLLAAAISFEDSSKQWLSGVPDVDGFFAQNWIRSGISSDEDSSAYDDHSTSINGSEFFWDPDETYEDILGGTWTPYALTSWNNLGPSNELLSHGFFEMDALQSVDIVFTADRSLWTRCPVIEMQPDPGLSEGGANKMRMRAAPSVDKYGSKAIAGTGASTNPDDPNFIAETGMGWFPGYAIDVETGERLNMAFGENSWLATENGRDMQWNPTGNVYSTLGTPLFGGMHYVYVFINERGNSGNMGQFPMYDEGQFMHERLSSPSPGAPRFVWQRAMWVGLPLVAPNRSLLESTARIKLRVAKPYETYYTGVSDNNDYPMYQFSMGELASTTDDLVTAEDALALINVVPNPYYAYSAYETSRLDQRVKVTNLPEECTVSIYNVSGTLVRQFHKSSPSTSLDWDLKNHANIPISGGVYIIHINAPGIGEKVLKWFGATRPADLENF